MDPAGLEEKLKGLVPFALKDTAVPKQKKSVSSSISVDPSILDYSEALRFAGNDEEVLKKIISSFALQNREYERKLPALLKEGKIKDIEVLAHTIKSGAKTIGAMELSGKAKEIEDYAKEEKTDSLEEHFDGFISELRKVLESVEKM